MGLESKGNGSCVKKKDNSEATKALINATNKASVTLTGPKSALDS
jgi:hypothetical protein